MIVCWNHHNNSLLGENQGLETTDFSYTEHGVKISKGWGDSNIILQFNSILQRLATEFQTNPPSLEMVYQFYPFIPPTNILEPLEDFYQVSRSENQQQGTSRWQLQTHFRIWEKRGNHLTFVIRICIWVISGLSLQQRTYVYMYIYIFLFFK